MKSSLHFLFAPIDAVGNVNPCIGLGQELIRRGHTVTFAVSNSWRGKLIPFGFIEKIFEAEIGESEPVDKWGEIIAATRPAMGLPTIEKIQPVNVPVFEQLIADVKATYQPLRRIVAEIQPDLILTDFMHNPALSDAGIPWILLMIPSPAGISVENVPPLLSGYPIDEKTAQWDEYHKKHKEMCGPIFESYKKWILENGGPELTFDGRSLWSADSPYANLYMYPQELNYTAYRPDPPKWHQFDNFIRSEPEHFEIPEKLRNLPGKLIYFSLGTIGCHDLELMRKMIKILSNSPHRFIISKGPLGDQLELADNMWGANRVPQTNVLPLVDLVIMHGGNNSTTETFNFGRKSIVLPLFWDQHDNAQRVAETGLGLQFNPYNVTEKELLEGIETLLKDDLLERRMRSISHRIKSAKSCEKAADLIEETARNNLNVSCC